METVINKQSEIIQNIVDFYKIQPGISASILEKLEDYLLLMNSFVVNALQELEEVSYETDYLALIVDILNTYLNSLLEETCKIFPDDDLKLFPLLNSNQYHVNEIQVLEYLKNLNARAENRFLIDKDIAECEECIYDEEFEEKLSATVKKLIFGIHSEIMVRVEDLV